MLASAKGRQLVAAIPRDRLLTESDGPFVTVEGRQACPRDIEGVISGLADLFRTGTAQMGQVIYDNFRGLLT
jgi:TatD DNase family protein